MARVYTEEQKVRYAAQRKEYAAKHKAEKAAYDKARCLTNVEERAEHARAYYEANKDAIILRSSEHYWANKERHNAQTSAYAASHKAEMRVYKAKWAKANPDAMRAKAHTRRARKLGSGGRLTKGLTAKLFASQAGLCVYCRVDLLTTGHHLDHIMPLVLGGPNIDSNMQALCPACNLHKGAKHPDTYIPRKT